LRGSFLLNSSVGRRFFNAFAKKIGSLNPARPTEIVSQKFIRQLPPYGPVIKISSWQKVTLACAVTLFCLIYGAAFALFVPFLLAPLIVPFLFLTLMVIWALPNSLNVAEYILTPLLYILFLAIVLWPSYLAVAIPNLPRITIVRLIGVTLTIFALLSLSTSNKFKSQLSIVMQSCKILCTVIIMLAVIETGSILFSGNKSNSLNVYITDTINSTVVFFVACYSFSSTGKAKSFAGPSLARAYPVISANQRSHDQSDFGGHRAAREGASYPSDVYDKLGVGRVSRSMYAVSVFLRYRGIDQGSKSCLLVLNSTCSSRDCHYSGPHGSSWDRGGRFLLSSVVGILGVAKKQK
jgi:hypothetical protein